MYMYVYIYFLYSDIKCSVMTVFDLKLSIEESNLQVLILKLLECLNYNTEKKCFMLLCVYLFI